jgi:phosphohistidine phosphatase
MKLVLVRHAEAESPGWVDSDRALTLRGHKQAQETSAWLASKVAQPSVLLVSPYRRARETAATIQQALPHAALHVVDHITPEDSVRQAIADLELAPRGDVVIVVSHMPLVAGLAGWLEHGVVTAGQPFSLAEARLYELALLGPSLAWLKDRFIPAL